MKVSASRRMMQNNNFMEKLYDSGSESCLDMHICGAFSKDEQIVSMISFASQFPL